MSNWLDRPTLTEVSRVISFTTAPAFPLGAVAASQRRETITTIKMPQVLPMTRRTMLIGAGALAALGLRPFEPRAYANEIETHGLSAYGDLKYPPDFRHVDYVNPDAPKGGILSFIGQTRANNQSFLTFNSLNSYILKGDGAQGMEWTFATLMAPSLDEPDSLYPAAARAVRIAADGRTYRFLLRQEAKFHDGTPLTAHDVAFSLTTLRTRAISISRKGWKAWKAPKRPMT